MNKFEQLGLSESLLKAILDLGFENPTEVQEKAIPLLLEKTHIWLRWLRQGQGKRQHLVFQLFRDANNRNTQALILSPTRELCLQTNEIKTTLNTKNINVVAVYGGASITEQAET
jgi:ATP-dependent RNA helicase DeaD